MDITTLAAAKSYTDKKTENCVVNDEKRKTFVKTDTGTTVDMIRGISIGGSFKFGTEVTLTDAEAQKMEKIYDYGVCNIFVDFTIEDGNLNSAQRLIMNLCDNWGENKAEYSCFFIMNGETAVFTLQGTLGEPWTACVRRF